MQLRHILAAADESDVGRQAVSTGLALATRCDARLTVLRVEAMAPAFAGLAAGNGSMVSEINHSRLRQLRRWLEADVLVGAEAERVQLNIAFGIPGIEICRVADQLAVDLIVVGRKRHSQRARLLLGDTADAVARRSRFPCLFVPPNATELRNLLVSLDGSPRGMVVLDTASRFARTIGARWQVVTVEPGAPEESALIGSPLPATRSSALEARAQVTSRRDGLPEIAVAIRRGDIARAILAEIQATSPDGLVIGYHRGGPPAMLEAGSTARLLAHAAPCSVLTVPL